MSPTRLRWVVAGSSGTDADGSLERPFSSPEQGLSRLEPGDELRISGGTWPRIVISRGGTPDLPIFITGDPDNPPMMGEIEVRAEHLSLQQLRLDGQLTVLSASGLSLMGMQIQSSATCARIQNIHFWSASNLNLGPCGEHGIEILAATVGTLSNIEIREIGGDGLRIGGGSVNIQVTGGELRQIGGTAVVLGGTTPLESLPPSGGGPAFVGRQLAISSLRIGEAAQGVRIDGCVDCAATHLSLTGTGLPFLLQSSNTPMAAFEATRALRLLNNVVVHATEPFEVDPTLDDAGERRVQLETTSVLGNLWFGAAPTTLGHGHSQTAPVDDPETARLDSPPEPGDLRLGAGINAAESTGDARSACWADRPAAGHLEAE